MLKRLILALLVGFLCATTASAGRDQEARKSSAEKALQRLQDGKGRVPAIQNKYFIKKERFEIAPLVGYVPNNPFAKRYVGSVSVGYYFTSQLGVDAQLSYSPDLAENDLKGLTITLVQIAHSGAGGSDFQQPLDKVTLSAAFNLSFTPFYGKINFIGEKVLTFDMYIIAGLGMVSKTGYYAEYDAQKENLVTLRPDKNAVRVAGSAGVGMNFFLTQSVAVKLDIRTLLYVDKQPQYDADAPASELQNRVYSNLVTSAGVSFYFPKMKPRLSAF